MIALQVVPSSEDIADLLASQGFWVMRLADVVDYTSNLAVSVGNSSDQLCLEMTLIDYYRIAETSSS